MMSDLPTNAKASRRLAAILAADIAGYSALMGADEEATVRELKAHQAVILPMIRQHSGRIIDTAGDGILAEFGSVLAAVKCALAMQGTMAERNAAVDPARRMQFRIGINQGDVIFDDARVYGDGVNVAARLEAIAEPGGICISAKVHDEISGRIEIASEDLGPQQLKNIAQPVRAYRIDAAPVAVAVADTRPTLALPDKPSIAVLPFTNLSGDKEQEYFSDGITADIITELSRFSELFVIARNSSFQYKGRSSDVRQVGRELGVRYVLEGSIRRSSNRVRITSQLIDATTGAHRWAERYDRELKDVFAVQDEVARTIVAILAAHVNKAEAERSLLKPSATWQAQDYYLRAVASFASFHRPVQAGAIYEARRLLEQCFALDFEFARAHVLLSTTQTSLFALPLNEEFLNPDTLEAAQRSAERAVQLDPNLPQAHAQLGYVLALKGEAERAVARFEHGKAFNPNVTDWRFPLVLIMSGHPLKAIETGQMLLRVDPFALTPVHAFLGLALYLLRKYPEARATLREFVLQSPNHLAGRLWLTAACGQMGGLEEGRSEVAQLLCLADLLQVEKYLELARRCFRPKHFTHLMDGLRKAGLPHGS